MFMQKESRLTYLVLEKKLKNARGTCTFKA